MIEDPLAGSTALPTELLEVAFQVGLEPTTRGTKITDHLRLGTKTKSRKILEVGVSFAMITNFNRLDRKLKARKFLDTGNIQKITRVSRLAIKSI